MKKKTPGQAMREYNVRVTKPHPCEGCKVALPPSTLRFCTQCRALLVRLLT